MAEHPNFDDFDVVLVNTSAGKDSLVMLDVIAQAIGDHPIKVVAVHADLGRVEWPGVRELAERQVARYGWRFEVVAHKRFDLLDGVEARGMWPSSSARFCTSDWKRGPIRTLMTRLADEHRDTGGTGPCRILSCMGFRAEESPARAKREPFAFDVSASAKTTRHVTTWLPVFDWTETEVWDAIRSLGLEYHPAYDLDGVTRLSCVFCVLASEAQLRAGIRALPHLAREYAAIEVRIGHTFKHRWAIAEAVEQELGPARLEGAGERA